MQAVLDRQKAPVLDSAPPKTPSEPEPTRPHGRPPSRREKRLIGGHFDPRVAKQLRLLAAEEDTTVQALLEEALDLLFVKKGRGKIIDV